MIYHFDLFDKTQIIDESKIECNNCKKKNKADSYKKEFFNMYFMSNEFMPSM